MSANNQACTCGKCGASMALLTIEGLCPRCLISEALEPEPVGPNDTKRIHNPFFVRRFGDYELLDEIAREKAGSLKVAKVNVDENQSLSLKYNIRAIPALLFFKNGQLRDQITGVTSKKDLLNRVDALA